MKHFSRILFTLLALVALILGLGVPVQAQETTNRYTLATAGAQQLYVASYIGSTTNMTYTVNKAIIGLDNIAVQLLVRGRHASATNSATATIQHSIDSTNWVTTGTMLLTTGGTLTTSTISNWTKLAISQWRLSTLVTGGSVTNIDVQLEATGSGN